jgi:hypothetical protein
MARTGGDFAVTVCPDTNHPSTTISAHLNDETYERPDITRSGRSMTAASNERIHPGDIADGEPGRWTGLSSFERRGAPGIRVKSTPFAGPKPPRRRVSGQKRFLASGHSRRDGVIDGIPPRGMTGTVPP